MDQETKPVASKEKHSAHHRQDEITPADDEFEEIEIPQNKSFYDKVTQVMEKFATTRMGQVIIERTDRVLKVVEDTAKWSLTQDDKDVHLERPLPWLLFLTLILWLRSLRIGLSLASFVVGSQQVTPESMVYYIQVKRRRLRAIRVHGLKAISSREQERTVMRSDSGKRVTFVGKLRSLMGNAICKPGQHREVPTRRVFIQSDKSQFSDDMAERSTKRPRDDDSVDLNLTVDQLLDKYANEDSDADSDYIPKDDEEDCSNSASCTSSSSDETDKDHIERIDENPEEEEKASAQNDKPTTKDESILEIKANGGTKYQTKPTPLAELKPVPMYDAESCNDQVQTPKATATANGPHDLPQPTDSGATTEVVSPKPDFLNTPNTKQQLLEAPPQFKEDDEQKSTPGHKSAASLKPAISTTAAAVPTPPPNGMHPEKCYRTITTQTSIEFDWSITLKTEITPIKKSPKLEKLDCTIHLTPASSTEDLFYSPIGSLQDFHSIFHPAPIVKSSPVEVPSTPKEAEDLDESSSAETPETAAKTQKKSLPNSNHNKQNNHHNAKNRNKNRR